MAKIAYRIVAVEDRRQYAEELCDMIEEPKTSIVYDEDHKGCPWNNNRICKEFLETDDYSHLLLIDDDAVVVNRFKQIVSMAVEHFPNAIWTFFDNTHRMKDRPIDTPYIELFNKNVRGICKVLPRYVIDPFLSFWEEEIETKYPKWNHEDTAKKMFALLNNIPVMGTIPSLVYARQIKSAIPTHHNITPNTDCWIGRDIDVRQFDTYKYEIDRIRSLFMTHLPRDAEIVKRCEDKFKRKVKVEKTLKGARSK